ncbi:hypothetical protein [Brotaphodocola sp.]|uniref:hypothetical protein n=1 Tax=Brotaphodocola sp. TaxID=3073577 RepID=UPI003D7D8A65
MKYVKAICIIVAFGIAISWFICSQRKEVMEEQLVYEVAKSPDDIKNQTLKYLNSLYEDEFTVVSATAPSIVESFARIMVKSKKYSDQIFLVKRSCKNGNVSFSDNYFTLYMKKDADLYVQEIVNQVLSDVQISTKFTEYDRPKKLDAKSNFNDYVAMGGSLFFYITITSRKELEEKERLDVMERFSNEKFRCTVIFCSGRSEFRYSIDSDYDIRKYN